MTHLNFDKRAKREVPEAWLPATAQATDFVVRISGHHDLICQVGPGFAAESQTAQYSPQLRTIELSTNVMLPGIRPEAVDFNDDLFNARHPLLRGALIHEAAHRRYSRFVPRDLVLLDVGFTKPMIDVLVLLEESRIEKRVLRRHHSLASKHLPAIVFDLLAKDFKIADNAYGAAVTAGLILARQDAGIITAEQAKPFRELVLSVLDQDTLNILRDCWKLYHSLPFREETELPVETMLEIARTWLEALGVNPDEAEPEGVEIAFGGVEGGEAGEAGEAGEGEGKPGGKGLAEKIAEAVADAAFEQAMEAASEVGEIKEKRGAQEREADAERHEDGKKAVKRAFPDNPPAHGHGAGGGARVSQRKPEPAEVGAAGIFAKQLERVIYTDKRVIKVNTDVPGGRLRGRAAMAADAAAAQGMTPDAKMWRKRKLAVTDEPTIRLGLAVDISGSMARAEQPLGSTAYIVGNGVTRADGVFASCVFGERIHGVVKPGQRIDRVPVVSATDAMEAFKDAFLALDSMLDLLDGDGLKVLVLASDGIFVDDEHAEYADLAMRLCEKRGVLVLHLDFTGELMDSIKARRWNARHGNKTLPLSIPRGTLPQEVAMLIGQRLIAEVAKLNMKRAAA